MKPYMKIWTHNGDDNWAVFKLNKNGTIYNYVTHNTPSNQWVEFIPVSRIRELKHEQIYKIRYMTKQEAFLDLL